MVMAIAIRLREALPTSTVIAMPTITKEVLPISRALSQIIRLEEDTQILVLTMEMVVSAKLRTTQRLASPL